MAKVSKEKQVADQAIRKLKDVIADLAVIAAGRSDEYRHRVISNTLYDVNELLREIDPVWIDIRRREAEEQAKRRRLEHAPARLLTHQPSLPFESR